LAYICISKRRRHREQRIGLFAEIETIPPADIPFIPVHREFFAQQVFASWQCVVMAVNVLVLKFFDW
jgi:hypothetical protein